MKNKGKGLYAAYMSEFVARCCCWTIASQLLVRLIRLHWEQAPQQLYLVGAVLSLLFLCTIFGGLIRDWLFGEKIVMTLGIIQICFGNLVLLIFPGAIYIGLAVMLLGAGMVTSSTPLVVTDLAVVEKKGRAFTILYGFTNAGVILGSVAGGLLFKYISWNALIGFNLCITVITIAIYGQTSFIKNVKSLQSADIFKYIFVVTVATMLAFFYLKIKTIAEIFLIMAALCYVVFVALIVYKRKQVRKQLLIAFLYILLAIVFFSGEFQIASTLVDFSKHFVNLKVLSFDVPAGSLVALESIFVILGAWAISKSSYLADKLDSNKKVFSGLIIGLMAFTILFTLTKSVKHTNISFIYIVVVFLLLGIADVIMTPPIMSYIATVSPSDIKGRLMAGTYFAFSVAGYLSGFIGYKISENYISPGNNLSFYSATFSTMIIIMGMAAIVGMVGILLKWQMRLSN